MKLVPGFVIVIVEIPNPTFPIALLPTPTGELKVIVGIFVWIPAVLIATLETDTVLTIAVAVLPIPVTPGIAGLFVAAAKVIKGIVV